MLGTVEQASTRLKKDRSSEALKKKEEKDAQVLVKVAEERSNARVRQRQEIREKKDREITAKLDTIKKTREVQIQLLVSLAIICHYPIE
jgi:hypothetical protein